MFEKRWIVILSVATGLVVRPKRCEELLWEYLCFFVFFPCLLNPIWCNCYESFLSAAGSHCKKSLFFKKTRYTKNTWFMKCYFHPFYFTYFLFIFLKWRQQIPKTRNCDFTDLTCCHSAPQPLDILCRASVTQPFTVSDFSHILYLDSRAPESMSQVILVSCTNAGLLLGVPSSD